MKIFKLQKRACRVILDYNVEDSNEAMQSLKIYLYMTTCFFEKQYHNLTPTYISEIFVHRNKMNMSNNLRSATPGCFSHHIQKRNALSKV